MMLENARPLMPGDPIGKAAKSMYRVPYIMAI